MSDLEQEIVEIEDDEDAHTVTPLRIMELMFLGTVFVGMIMFGVIVFWAIASPSSVPECPELRLGVCRIEK